MFKYCQAFGVAQQPETKSLCVETFKPVSVGGNDTTAKSSIIIVFKQNSKGIFSIIPGF